MSRSEVLSLYRQFLRIGSRMSVSSPNHGLHVVRRAKREFKEQARLEDAEERREAVELARVLLDALKVQQVHKELGLHRKPGVAGDAATRRGEEDYW